MITYDDKTEGVFTSGERFIVPHSIDSDDLIFKASYIVESNIKCKGKITALFDLIVVGDVEAYEIDVKGRFICIGKCKANTITVYGEIWAEEIIAINIETNSRITAQEIKAKTIIAESNILVSHTIEIDNTAESNKAIICGETVFGAGVLCSPVLFTGEPLDLDNGEEAVIIKDSTQKSEESNHITDKLIGTGTEANLIQIGEKSFKQENDFCGYLDLVISSAHDDEEREKFKRWKAVLQEVELSCHSLDKCKNIVQLIWLSEIANSDHFRNWSKVDEMFIMLDQHFTNLLYSNSDSIICTVNNYSELLMALNILHNYGDILSEELYDWIFEQLISNLGLKPEFIYKRLKEKGWATHGEQ
ncbi:MAG: hypothetical protein JG769_627 [Oscillospiraceae bacterium]|jgi:cytoskeletal protein CcmA (bactofilin family)|nr:hypothetical protein [Oscillospiraceae bacterium]